MNNTSIIWNNNNLYQGSSLGQKHFLARKLFLVGMHSRQESRQVIFYENLELKDEQEVALGNYNVRAACAKDKLEFNFCLSTAHNICIARLILRYKKRV